ncbi:uncharacterized protein LOC143488839 [Brachyhypopomus gauderio]|uniref:uncharacterized protein LOC143488839 n=1 Tax=Brachyhypopomus gauderio TaxID=698409 RepID=UPI004042C0BF
MTLQLHAGFILDMAKQGMSSIDISDVLSSQFGVQRGISARSVRMFCVEHGFFRTSRLSDSHLELEMARAINETGPSFGRKMMTGYLFTKGIHVAERRVGEVLRTTHPPYHEARRQGARNLNPVPYHAEYVGHKLHMDQNEKLVMFGVTHVVAVDGFSRKVVSHSTMPIKNNLIIYEEVYRPAVLAYGMWDQIRVDHGKEFYLSLFIQEMLSSFRHNTIRMPYLQTASTRNHIVERIWPEINGRINYPLKTALVQLVDQEAIDMEDSVEQYCVSNLTCRLSHIGVSRVVDTWNAHRIPGKGVPNHFAASGCPKQIAEELLPHASQAADLYREQLGSFLTRNSIFGMDPFSTTEDRASVERQFAETYPNISYLLEKTVNNDFTHFKDALLHLINLTKRFA